MENENKELTIKLTGLEVRQMVETLKTWKEDREEIHIRFMKSHGHYDDEEMNEDCVMCMNKSSEEYDKQKLDLRSLEVSFGDIPLCFISKMEEKLNGEMEKLLSSIVIEHTETTHNQ